MTRLITIICLLVLLGGVVFGQHSLDSCNVCNCKKWHRIVSSGDDGKKVLLTKEKGASCKHAKYCDHVVVDGKCKYHYKTSFYNSKGQLYRTEFSKGWASGWGGKSKLITISYSTTGKRENKTKSKQ